MLALKTLASTDAPGKTLIFDEVDAGIGGAVADVVGARLQAARRARSRCSASRTCRRSPPTATSHFRIAKTLKDGRTVTGVAPLGVRDREDELARMIGGADVSASVRASAREMLKRRGAVSANIRRKAKAKVPRGTEAKVPECPGNTSSRRTAAR